MNPVNTAVRILDDEFNLSAFLPSVNYFYYYLEQEAPTQELMLTTGGAIFVSAVLFNILSEASILGANGPVTEQSADNDSRTRDVDSRGVLVFVGVLFGWVPLLLFGILNLYSIFGGETIWPETLVAGSILFLSLLTSDLILNRLLPSHGAN
jgi:hypothetical protein